MPDAFLLNGQFSVAPLTGALSGAPSAVTPLLEQTVLIRQATATYDLIADAVQTVLLGGMSVNVLAIKTYGGKIRVRLTSADGSAQALPVDSLLVLMAQSVPFTAVDIMRAPGVHTIVNVFLGQSA